MKDPNQAVESVPSENWDEDFEFQQGNQPGERDTTSELMSVGSNPTVSPICGPFSRDDDWANDEKAGGQYPLTTGSSSGNKNDISLFSLSKTHFNNWHESNPSTPKKNSNLTENWDDDFEDGDHSPLRRLASQPLGLARSEFTQSVSSYSQQRNRSSACVSESWMGDSRNESNVSPIKRTRYHAYTDSSDDDEELGFADKDEDRTITARLRPRATFSHPSPPPPVPLLRTVDLGINGAAPEPFPRSPTNSSFSTQIPSTPARTSSSNLLLRRTMSGASSTLALLPPSPPIHRERRRLRKKSRPPRPENNVLELQDQPVLPPSSSSPVCPSIPERSTTPPITTPGRLTSPASSASPASNKVPLITRIGSVKRWGARKKRDSATPSEIAQEVECVDSTAQTPRNGWFFRNISSAPDTATSTTDSESNEKMEINPPHAFLNPTSDVPIVNITTHDPGATRLGKRRSLGFVGTRKRDHAAKDCDVVQPQVLIKPRRPASMQPYAKPRDSSHTVGVPTPVPIKPSASGVRAIGSMSVEDLAGGVQRHPGRNAITGIRRVSLTNAGTMHKRTRSSGPMGFVECLPVTISASKLGIAPEQKVEQSMRLQTSSPFQSSDCLNGCKPIPTHAEGPSQSDPHTTEVNNAFLPSVPITVVTGTPTQNIKAASAQTASLGRSTPPVSASKTAAILRRNSLSDLKIPTRITDAQVGLKRDLKMVREFAANVEQLKALEATYVSLVEKMRSRIDTRDRSYPTPPAVLRPPSSSGRRPRSNTDTDVPKVSPKRLASALDHINSRYLIDWECAGLLIELGGSTRTPSSSPPVSVSEPAMTSHLAPPEIKKNRERAITLAGEESKPNPILTAGPLTTNTVNLARNASTERHPLNERQLNLLEEILKNNNSPMVDPLPILEESAPNREWKWGDAMSSTVTLPSEGSQGTKKKRGSRLRLNGLRNMLRSLKRNYSGEPLPLPLYSPVDKVDKSSAMAGECQHQNTNHLLNQRRRAKTTADAQPPHHGLQPNRDASLAQVPSSRRPSLASIFRLGQRNKSTSVTSSVDNVHSIATESSTRDSCSITDDGDWDRLESSSDLEPGDTNLSETLRGRSPYLSPRYLPSPLGSRNPSKSQSSIAPEPLQSAAPPSAGADGVGSGNKAVNQARPFSRPALLGHSAQPGTLPPTTTRESNHLTSPKLAMTPENIKPLLENSKEVISRLQKCIAEMHRLLDGDAT